MVEGIQICTEIESQLVRELKRGEVNFLGFSLGLEGSLAEGDLGENEFQF